VIQPRKFFVVGADAVTEAEGSTEAPRWPGAEVPPGSKEQGMYALGFPRNLGGVRREGGRRDRCSRSDPTDAGCIRDGGWPSGAALQGEAPNHGELRRLRAGVVSVAEKAHQQCVRYELRRRTRVNH